MPPLRVIICGALGRMGGRVAALAQEDSRFAVVAGVVSYLPANPRALFPLLTEKELPAQLPGADMLIDFTSPAASARFARLAAKAKTPIVIGTTGLSSAQLSLLRQASRKTAVFLSPNFSPGMNVVFQLARIAGAALPAWDASLHEIHHSAKKDAPSGTALRLAESARPKGKAPIVSERAGDIVGDHTLTLAGPFERLELVHRAQSRDVFAQGALSAALWLRGRRPGLYGMQDMLRL